MLEEQQKRLLDSNEPLKSQLRQKLIEHLGVNEIDLENYSFKANA